MFKRKREIAKNNHPVSDYYDYRREVRELSEAVEKNTELLWDLLGMASLGVLLVLDFVVSWERARNA
jgi:hypothetical protein